jgi:hypothetical protein
MRPYLSSLLIEGGAFPLAGHCVACSLLCGERMDSQPWRKRDDLRAGRCYRRHIALCHLFILLNFVFPSPYSVLHCYENIVAVQTIKQPHSTLSPLSVWRLTEFAGSPAPS